MNATVEDLGDVTIVSLYGFLDFESVVPFRNYCLNQLVKKRVIFDMRGLNFVGSSGITTFLETMRDYRGMAPAQPRFCGVGAEFKRLFTTARLAGLELFENPNAAIYGTSAEIIPEWIETPIEETDSSFEVSETIEAKDLLPTGLPEEASSEGQDAIMENNSSGEFLSPQEIIRSKGN